IWMDLGQETDIYIPRIKWLPNSQTLAIYRLNRDQNQLELLFGDITTGQTRTILVEHEKQGWLDITDDLTFLKDGKGFIWSSDQDGFRHLYLYDLSGHLIRQLTRGHWEVENIVRVDEENSVVYFTATEKSPLERHLYRVNLDGQGFKRLSTREGTHHINMAPNCKYYLDSFSNVTTPTQVSLHTSDGRMKELIEPNEIEALKDYQLSPPEFLTLKTEDDAVLNAYLIKPVNFDPEKKYPVLIYTYGGPGSQIVRNHWPLDRYFWHQMLTQKGYLIFALDNRGTGGRGKMFMKQVYRRLGEYEVKDQINGVKFLRSLPYVDGNRIGIWGWSYGGYTTCMCMLKGAEYFKLGIAVAPVTDWKNYDTIYTERYMDQPGDNSEGYEESSTLIHAEKLKGKLLLVHGDADDNVHLSNTLQLAQALQQADRPFDLMVYPRKMHGIRGAQVHLFKMLTDYILQNL
ncbi:MAG: prolyl oligopeptidase family serine peptidase, partial [candidate division KSB1 bacterium]|nr:prolyl oligopeptidase family serine peptidase [candidate division KSB1 bacterium]